MLRVSFRWMLILLLSCSVWSREVFLWVQYGDAAHNQTKSNFDKYPHIEEGLTALALQYWNTASDGSIPYISNENSSSDVTYWLNRVRPKGIDVYMTVTCIYSGHAWNPYVIDALMKNRAAYVRNILDTVDHYDLDGVDIDLEATWRISAAEGLNEYPLLLKELRDSLDVRGKKLSMAIFAGDDPNWYNNFPQVYDTKQWAEYLDYVNVMGYNETYESHTGNLKYSYILNEFKEHGFADGAVNLGLPAWVNSWGSPSKGPKEHVQDINNLDGGVCIWDSKLANGSATWTSTELWAELKKTKENSALPQFVIQTSTEGAGKISPSGYVKVDSATNKTFTITPDKWYLIDYIEVDGVNKGAKSSYTFEKVEKAHTLKAVFKEDPDAPDLFTVTTSVGENGAVSPEGTFVVEDGKDTIVTFNAKSGYVIDWVKVNGSKRGPIKKITIENIKKNLTFEGAFKETSGGDLGKYGTWESPHDYTQGDTIHYNDTLWLYQGNTGIGGWGSTMEPSKSLADKYGTPPWLYVGLYDATPDSLVSATAVYKGGTTGQDTLVVTTDSSAMGTVYKTVVDTFLIGDVAILNQQSTVVPLGISLVGTGQLLSIPKAGWYTITLSDTRGRIVQKVKRQLAAGIHALDVRKDLAKGLYILQVYGNQVKFAEKIHL